MPMLIGTFGVHRRCGHAKHSGLPHKLLWVIEFLPHKKNKKTKTKNKSSETLSHPPLSTHPPPSTPPHPHNLGVGVLRVRVVALVQHQQVHHFETHKRNAQHVDQDLGGHHQHLCHTHRPRHPFKSFPGSLFHFVSSPALRSRAFTCAQQ